MIDMEHMQITMEVDDCCLDHVKIFCSLLLTVAWFVLVEIKHLG
jgi:hypothetical protein